MPRNSKSGKWKMSSEGGSASGGENGKLEKVLIWSFVFSILHFPFSVSLAEEGKFVYNSHNKRDPFYPIVSEQGEFLASAGAVENLNGDLALEGIVWDEKGGSVAIINGAIVQQGEQVGMYQVRMIQETTVLLESEEGELILRMPAEEKGEK